jgi:hypothetical protein
MNGDFKKKKHSSGINFDVALITILLREVARRIYPGRIQIISNLPQNMVVNK